MKALITKLLEPSESPVFPKTPHTLRPAIQEADPSRKAEKRANIFSKSRDKREDRGLRQMKTSRNAQTLPHGHY